ncbi:MAG: ATP-binding cassette domain-containing protein, partial [Clostridia bacterium]|nr:ATP-binding cassette domain-containing protein [Clostridia bacterium]
MILSFNDVGYTYHTKDGETNAIAHMTFAVERGQFVSVIGPSGCGKTTILSLIAGLLTPSYGSITRENAEFGYMLQRDALFPWRTVEANLFLPLEIKKRNTPEMRENALRLAEKYGLKDFLKKKPAELSGGMRQRVAL